VVWQSIRNWSYQTDHIGATAAFERLEITMSQPRFESSARSRIRRHPERGSYDEAQVFQILDAGLLAHVAYLVDGVPVVTPTTYWREGRTLYWHGAAASRMLRTVAEGQPTCVAVSLMDGLVLAPSGFAHSVNYRSVVAFGRARMVDDIGVKRAATDAFIERLYPGRAARLRPSTEQELTSVSLVEMPIEEASAKVRDGGLKALEADEGWEAWSGVLPLETRIGTPQPDAKLGATALGQPDVPPYREGERLDRALTAAAVRASRARESV
jgi:nitroimidazol reductase NimA-like FMN-containing flavoprotein (pyridoxamine 5'-phosphate oxidase superfamily)